MKASHFIRLLLLYGMVTAHTQVHTSYLWHLQQPIYWPEVSTWDPNRFQTVWESQFLKDNNGNWYADSHVHVHGADPKET